MTVYEMELHCPDIKNQSDVQDVRIRLSGSPGIVDFSVDLPSHRVLVTTANQDGGEDVRRRLTSAGFPPDE